jgi:hypothetical protein
VALILCNQLGWVIHNQSDGWDKASEGEREFFLFQADAVLAALCLEQVGWRAPTGYFVPAHSLTDNEVERGGFIAVYRLGGTDVCT